MTTVIVTRHRGAIEWLKHHGIRGEVRDHISADEIAALPPCFIVGVLPLPLAVAAVQAGHRYISLQLDLSRAQRGQELSVAEMEGIATLQELQLQHRYLYGDSPWRHWPSGIADAHAGDLQAFRIGLASLTPAEVKEEMDRTSIAASDTVLRCCPVCGNGVPLSGAPATADWVPCSDECREYHERFGDRADVMYATRQLGDDKHENS